MKIIKSLLKNNDDPYIALMIHCSTPLHNGFSFSDLPTNRQLHTTLPILESQLQPPIKTSGSELRGQEEAACTHVLGLCDHYSELFTRMEALNFKMLWLSRYYSYRLVYYRSSTSYRVEPTYEGSVKLAQPFLKNQPVREFWRSFP